MTIRQGTDGMHYSVPATATAVDLHVLLGVKPGTLRQWHARGKVAKSGRDAYVVADVVAQLGRSS